MGYDSLIITQSEFYDICQKEYDLKDLKVGKFPCDLNSIRSSFDACTNLSPRDYYMHVEKFTRYSIDTTGVIIGIFSSQNSLVSYAVDRYYHIRPGEDVVYYDISPYESYEDFERSFLSLNTDTSLEEYFCDEIGSVFNRAIRSLKNFYDIRDKTANRSPRSTIIDYIKYL